MRYAVLAALALLAAGCATPEGPAPDEPTATGTPTGSPAAVSPEVMTLPPTTSSPEEEPLSFIEQELLGTWVRLQVRGAGGSNEWRYWSYTAFLDDRTMCEWKHGQESSTDSDDGDYDYVEYGPWEVTEDRSGGEYLVEAEGAGIQWVFDHSNDRMWLFGFSDLQSTRATDGKTCSVR